MELLTATACLRGRKTNSLQDSVVLAGSCRVTYLLVLSKMETSIYIKLMHLPGGPTLIFQTNTYKLVDAVVSSLYPCA